MESSARELMTLPPATLIDGRYEVDRCIGIGTMSVVYAAKRLVDGAPCALKILCPAHPADISSTTFHTRFRIAARMAQLVDHPNVVKVVDFIDQPDLLAAVMELVKGGDLASRLQSNGPYSIPEAIRVLKQILNGMQAIHGAGVIHRDIKPANILLDEKGDAKISDFGIARSGESPRLTAQGGVVGTIQYLSPEQLQGEEATMLSDIYALGIVAYEMLTGDVPGADRSLCKLVDQRVSSESVPVQILNPHCPPRLAALIGKALHRNPAERFQDISAMLEELEGIPESEIEARTDGALSVKDPTPARLKNSRAWQVFQGTGFQFILALCLIAFFVGALRLPSSSNVPANPASSSSAPASTGPQQTAIVSDDAAANVALKTNVLPAAVDASHPIEDLAALSAQQTLLYRMADFVRWPQGTYSAPGVPLRLCIVGKDPFGLGLDRILSKSKTLSGKSFWLQRYVSTTPTDMLAGCQILYIGAMAAAEANTLLTPLRSLPVLTVSEGTGQGIVDFVTRDGRASFVVNQALSKQSGLELSAILLDVGAKTGG